MKINKSIKKFKLTNNHKYVNNKIFSSYYYRYAFNMANFQCMKWYIQKLLSKNTGGSEQAVFPERKVECIKSLNRPGPVNTNTK